MSLCISAQTERLPTPKKLVLNEQLVMPLSTEVAQKSDTSGSADFEKMKGLLIVPVDKYLSAKNRGQDLDVTNILITTFNPMIKFEVTCDSTAKALAIAKLDPAHRIKTK
ncbi:MAG: hypothetical protein JKY52_18350 [Flavobacteriales bacterium]|nr:hypothetical protein [Flavobacteriales bacterium]